MCRSCRWRGTWHGEWAVALKEDTGNKTGEFADTLVDVIAPSALHGIVRFAAPASFFGEVGVGIEVFCGRCGRGGECGGFRKATDVRRGCEMVSGDAVDGYTVEGLDVGGGYTHAGCAGTVVNGRVSIVRGGRGL